MRPCALVLFALLAPLAAQAQLPPQRAIIVSPQAPVPQSPAGRQIPGEAPGVAAAQREHEACVERNQRAWDLWNASANVVATVQRRDELKKIGERSQWKDQSRPNLERAERELAMYWSRYQSAGGTARAPEEATRAADPCREADEKVRAAVREAYAPGPSPVRRSAVQFGAPEK